MLHFRVCEYSQSTEAPPDWEPHRCNQWLRNRRRVPSNRGNRAGRIWKLASKQLGWKSPWADYIIGYMTRKVLANINLPFALRDWWVFISQVFHVPYVLKYRSTFIFARLKKKALTLKISGLLKQTEMLCRSAQTQSSKAWCERHSTKACAVHAVIVWSY